MFLPFRGAGAAAVGSVFASKKGAARMRAFIASRLEGRPEYQARANRFGGVRPMSAAMAGSGLTGNVNAN
ncbi:hypothetical protein AB0I51_02220 [Streptomyces sp. NPDC050549]|uniref:hypothetical protein n=1 Tax=Streptomyces sp. NPDC050549 TaxID=3155406 RepID=UPI0034174604